MDNMSNKKQTRGRPVSGNVSEAVYRAALELVAVSGFARITRSEIAALAGVSRQTLYNRWESVGDIVLEALLVRGEREIGVAVEAQAPMTAEEKLRKYLEGLAVALEGWAAPGLKAVVALAQQDEAFAQRFRQNFLGPRHQPLAEVIRGACTANGQDARLVAELIAASMWYRLLISGETLDLVWIDVMTKLAAKR